MPASGIVFGRDGRGAGSQALTFLPAGSGDGDRLALRWHLCEYINFAITPH